MAIPIYFTSYKWSDKATSLSKTFSFITIIGGAFGIILLASGIMAADIGALFIGLLLLCSILLLNKYSSKILQKVAKIDIERKIAKDINFATMYFLEYPNLLSYILKLNPNFEQTYRNILNEQWYCGKCGSWNSVVYNKCDCGATNNIINK